MAQMTRGSAPYNHYLKEYLLWRAVRTCQSLFEGNGISSYESTKDPYVIFRSEVLLDLRHKFLARAAELDAQGGDDVANFADAIRDVIADRVKRDGNAVEDVFVEDLAGTLDTCIRDFDRSVRMGELPLSPYDPDVARHESCCLAGTRLCLFNLEEEGASCDFDEAGRLTPDSWAGHIARFDASNNDKAGGSFEPAWLSVSGVGSVEANDPNYVSGNDFAPEMLWEMPSDTSRVHVLASRMKTQEDFAKVASSILSASSLRGETLEEEQAGRARVASQVNMAVHILDQLDADGISWELVDGDNPGQLSIQVGDSSKYGARIRMRLVDIDDPRLVGRVMVGSNVVYRTDVRHYIPGTSRDEYRNSVLAPDMTTFVEDHGENVRFGVNQVLNPLYKVLNQPINMVSAPDANGIRHIEDELSGRLVTDFDSLDVVPSSSFGNRRRYTVRRPSYINADGGRQTCVKPDDSHRAESLYVKKYRSKGTLYDYNEKFIGSTASEKRDPLRFVTASVEKARDAWTKALDIDSMFEVGREEVRRADEHEERAEKLAQALEDGDISPEDVNQADLESYVPVSSDAVDLGISDLDGLKRSYLRILLGEADALERPEDHAVSEADDVALVDSNGKEWLSVSRVMDMAEASGESISLQEARERVVSFHAADMLSSEIGTFEPTDHVASVSEDGVATIHSRRFNPAGLSEWASGNDNRFIYSENLTRALACLIHGVDDEGNTFIDKAELLGVDPETGKGIDVASQRLMDRTARFDPHKVVDEAGNQVWPKPLATLVDETFGEEQVFWSELGSTIITGLRQQGVEPSSIEVDEGGHVRWHGYYATQMAVFKGEGNSQVTFASKQEAREAYEAAMRGEGPYQIVNPIDAAGDIGPFFAPDELGIVRCEFEGSDDYSFVPGYDATFDSSIQHRTQPLSERLILKGYLQRVQDAVRIQLVTDVMSLSGRESDKVVGSPVSMLKTVRNISATAHRHPGLDYGKDIFSDLASEDEDVAQAARMLSASIRTESRRVRFPTAVVEEAGPRTALDMANGRRRAGDDTRPNLFSSVGERSMSLIKADADFAGLFDPTAGNVGSKNGIAQATLVSGAYVNPDGSVEKAHVVERDENGDVVYDEVTALDEDGNVLVDMEGNPLVEFQPRYVLDETGQPIVDVNARAPLFDPHDEDFSYFGKHTARDAADRNAMTFSNAMTAHTLTCPVGTALTTVAGYGQNDAIIVTDTFANRYAIEDEATGELSPLTVGDKISDIHGNKGVLSLVVPVDGIRDYFGDSTLSHIEPGSEQAREMMDVFFNDGVTKEEFVLPVVNFCLENPELSVIQPPFADLSRLTGSRYEECLAAGPAKTLHRPGLEDVPGGLVQSVFVVTDKTAIAKCHVYDEKDHMAGGGRCASAQFGGVMTSFDVPAVSKEIFGNNAKAMSELRERYMVCGVYMEDDSSLSVISDNEEGVQKVLGLDENGNHRNLLYFHPEDIVMSSDGTKINTRDTLENAYQQLDVMGGTMLLPFALSLGRGDGFTPDVTETLKAMGEFPKGWPENAHVYALPLESISLRQEREDSATGSGYFVHEHTTSYQDIMRASMNFICAEMQIQNEGANLTEDELSGLLSRQEACVKDAADAYDALKADIEHSTLTWGMKRQAMAVRQANSATEVWMPNPNLALDEVGMGPETAKHLKLKEGDLALVWRDPLLRQGGMRGMRVRIIDGMAEGVSIHPSSALSFDGDFDGDTVGIVGIHTPSAKREIESKMMAASNLLDYASPEIELIDGTMGHGFFFDEGLDVAAGFSKDPEVKRAHDELLCEVNHFVNEVEPASAAHDGDDFSNGPVLGYMGPRARLAKKQQFVKRLGDIYTQALCGRGVVAESTLDLTSPTTFCKSIYDEAICGAHKGKLSALESYIDRAGFEFTGAGSISDYEDGKAPELVAMGDSAIDYDNVRAQLTASFIKAYFVGDAGVDLQNAMMVTSGISPLAARGANDTTQPTTQSLLQAKHDAVFAMQQAKFVTTAAKHLWQGHACTIREGENGVEIEPVLVDIDRAKDNPFKEVPPAPRGKAYVHVSPDEWAENLYQAYKLNGVEIDKSVITSYLEEIRPQMTHAMKESGPLYKKGQEVFVGFRTESVEGEPVAHNRLATLCYRGTPDMIYDLALSGNERIYEPDNCFAQTFMPNCIRKAQEVVDSPSDENTVETYRKLQMDDAMYGTGARNRRHRSVSTTSAEQAKAQEAFSTIQDASGKVVEKERLLATVGGIESRLYDD